MRKLTIILLLTILANGCTKNPVVTGDGVEISIGLTSIEISQTKATSEFLASGSTVRIFAYNQANELVAENTFVVLEGAGVLHSCTVNASGVINSAPGDLGSNIMKLPSAGKYIFYAVCPAIQTQSSVDTKTIPVPSTVDLLHSTTGSVDAPISVSGEDATIDLIPFSHKQSQIQMDVRVDFAVPGTSVAIGEDGVTFTNQTEGPLNFTVLDAKFNLTNITTTNIVLPFLDFESQTLENELVALGIDARFLLKKPRMIFPTKINNNFKIISNLLIGENSLKLTTKELTHTFLSGLKYTFTLVITDEGILLYLMVTPWGSIDWDSNFGENVIYFIGGWENEGYNWESGHGNDINYGNGNAWIPAVEWKGDYGGGIISGNEVQPWTEDKGWEDIVGKNI